MAYYYGQCDGEFAFLDTATGVSPDDFFDEYADIPDDYYQQLLDEQCAGKVIVDSGACYPAPETQDCGDCTCVKVPKLKVETPLSDESFLTSTVELSRKNVTPKGSVVANISTTSATVLLQANFGPNTSKVGVTRSSNLGTFTVQGVESTSIWARSGSNQGTKIKSDNDKIQLYHTKNGQTDADHLQVCHGGSYYADGGDVNVDEDGAGNLTLRPSGDYGADLGDTDHCFGTLHCRDILFYGKIKGAGGEIEGNLNGTANRAISDDAGNTIKTTYAKEIAAYTSTGIGLKDATGTYRSTIDLGSFVAKIIKGGTGDSCYASVGSIGLFVAKTSQYARTVPAGTAFTGTDLYEIVVTIDDDGAITYTGAFGDTASGTWRLINKGYATSQSATFAGYVFGLFIKIA